MTKEQKINWLANASDEKLVKQFETSAMWASDPFTYAKKTGYAFEEIMEDYDLVRAELLKRLAK